MRKTLWSLAPRRACSPAARSTQPAPPELDLPPADGDRRRQRAARALVDGVRRSGAHRARRRGARQQPRPRGGARAHRGRARAVLLLASVEPVSRTSTCAAAQSRTRESQVDRQSIDANSPAGSARRQQRLLARPRSCPTRSTCGASTAAARWPPPTTCSPRATTARRCASRSPPTSPRAYFRLRAADALAVVLEDTLKSRAETVELQRDRFEAGLIGEYDLRQAEAELSAVVADIARVRQAIAVTESALATLTGRSPREVFTPQIARGASIEAATAVPQLPSGLPSGLLERRPDIRRAEALLASSDLRIQQARADYFPNLTLTGLFGTESATLANLFTVAGGDLALRPGPRAAAAGAEADRGRRRGGHRAAHRSHRAVCADRADGVPRRARRAGDEPLRQRGARRRDRGAASSCSRRSKWPTCATTPAARRTSKCSTRSARCSPPRRCASRRRATRGCRSSTSPRRSAAAGARRRSPPRIDAP